MRARFASIQSRMWNSDTMILYMTAVQAADEYNFGTRCGDCRSVLMVTSGQQKGKSATHALTQSVMPKPSSNWDPLLLISQVLFFLTVVSIKWH
jgi:hypothetical protein